MDCFGLSCGSGSTSSRTRVKRLRERKRGISLEEGFFTGREVGMPNIYPNHRSLTKSGSLYRSCSNF